MWEPVNLFFVLHLLFSQVLLCWLRCFPCFTSPVCFTGSYTGGYAEETTVHYTCCLKLPYFNLTPWQTIIFRNIWDFVFFVRLLENIWRWTFVRFRLLLFVKDILLFTLPAYSRKTLSSNRSLLSMRGILLGYTYLSSLFLAQPTFLSSFLCALSTLLEPLRGLIGYSHFCIYTLDRDSHRGDNRGCLKLHRGL